MHRLSEGGDSLEEVAVSSYDHGVADLTVHRVCYLRKSVLL